MAKKKKIRNVVVFLFLFLCVFLALYILLLFWWANIVLTTPNEVDRIWEENKAQYGDTREARENTAKAIKGLPGISDAGIEEDRSVIWYKFIFGGSGSFWFIKEGAA